MQTACDAVLRDGAHLISRQEFVSNELSLFLPVVDRLPFTRKVNQELQYISILKSLRVIHTLFYFCILSAFEGSRQILVHAEVHESPDHRIRQCYGTEITTEATTAAASRTRSSSRCRWPDLVHKWKCTQRESCQSYNGVFSRNWPGYSQDGNSDGTVARRP